MNALVLDRIQFAFTITYHYLFPQLTMGLGLLILVMKLIALKKSDDRWNKAARFWAKIFAVNFLHGVPPTEELHICTLWLGIALPG